MSIVIKPTANSNFRRLTGAESKWMIPQSLTYKFSAFENNTRLFRNGTFSTNLSKQTMTSISLTAGDVMSSDKPFTFCSTGGGTLGICYAWEGTIFGHRIDRYTPTFYITATRETATVTITRQTGGTVVVNAQSVEKDELFTYTAADTNDQYIITSDTPIACYVDDVEGSGDAADSLPLFPASTDLFGTFSGGGHVIASQASTSFDGYSSGGTYKNGILSAIGAVTEDVIGAGSQFTGASSRIIADKPVFVESQADADGGEMTPFVSKEAFGTQFIIPSNENEFVKLTSDVPANYEVFNSSGTSVGTGTLSGVEISGVEGGIYDAYLGSATAGSTLTTEGNLIVTDQPVYAIFEADGDDETILIARAPVNNGSTNVNAKTVTDGLIFYYDFANTRSYPGTGSTVNDLSIVGNTSGSTVGSPSFLSSNLGVFNFSLGNNYLSYNCENQSTVFNGSNNFTMSLWFNPDAVAPSTGSSNAPLLFRIGTQSLFFTMGDGGAADELHLRVNQNSTWQTTVSSTSLDLQEWYCFVVTYNASSGYVSYTNGVQTETSSVTGTITSSSGVNSIGSVTNREYDGRIAAALLYDRDLSATEVAQNFEALRGRFGI